MEQDQRQAAWGQLTSAQQTDEWQRYYQQEPKRVVSPMETHARQAWGATVAVPRWFAERKQERKRTQSLGHRAAVTGLTWLLFGFLFTFVLPYLIIATVEVGVVAYALVVTLVWGAAALVGRVRGNLG